MPPPRKKVWELPPHTEMKHAILKRYMGAWLPKLRTFGRVVFVDGFAGPGEYAGGEPGSPTIVLDLAANHQQDLSACEINLVFIEKNKARLENLQTVAARREIPDHITLHYIDAPFADALDTILAEVESDGGRLAPSFVMIDPFGWTGIPFRLIERLGGHARSEVFVTFMYEDINRFINHPDQEGNWDELFGTPEWTGINQVAGADARRDFLLTLYLNQLRQAGFSYVYPFEMRDDGNRVQYYLVFGSQSLDGLAAMKEAMWKVAPDGSFTFSDYVHARERTKPPLLRDGPNYDDLKSRIWDRLAERSWIDVATELREFVLVETPYLDTHYKKQILSPAEKSEEIEVRRPGGKTSRYWNSGTSIRLGGDR